MRKNYYIYNRISRIGICSFAMQIILAALILAAGYLHIGTKVIAVIMVLQGVLFFQLLHLRVLRPIRINNRVKRSFAKGHSYEDIYHIVYPMSQDEEEMFDRFSQMLDKNELINATNKSAEYLALQNQINPHFLYNTLEGIRAEAVIAGVDSIAEMTEALATYFQYTITNVKKLVTLEEELENIENYYYIQQFRFGNRVRLRVTYDCDEEDEALTCLLPKLTLQPIVENSIYHGLEQKIGQGNLNIRITMTDVNLIIMVSDDGVGMSKEHILKMNEKLRVLALSKEDEENREGKGSGIAVSNVNNRIKLLFGEEYGIYFYSHIGHGTDVEITLPVIKSDHSE